MSRRGGTSQGDAASSAAGKGKKQKKRKLSDDIAVGDAQAGGEARALRNRSGGWDLRHLSVDFLCSFMDSGEEGTGVGLGISRVNAVLGLVLLFCLLRFETFYHKICV